MPKERTHDSDRRDRIACKSLIWLDLPPVRRLAQRLLQSRVKGHPAVGAAPTRIPPRFAADGKPGPSTLPVPADAATKPERPSAFARVAASLPARETGVAALTRR